GQHALCVTAVGHCGREEEGLAWRDLVVLPDVGHYLLVCHGWPGTGRQTGKGHAGAEQFEEVAPVYAAFQWGSLARELFAQVLLKLVCVGEFIEAAPVGDALFACETLSDLREVERRGCW